MQTTNTSIITKNTSDVLNSGEGKKETKNDSENFETESANNLKQNISESTPINDFHFPVVNL